MTIICPRCAARFSVAGTSGITCPACGARLALRDDPSRRSSTPATSQRRSHVSAPIIDLPIPKRALTVTLDASPSPARIASSLGGSTPNRRPAARPQERWRLRLEQLADLPDPVGELPRTGKKGAPLRSPVVAKPTPAVPSQTATERAAPRIPVTRPEIPVGLPPRNEATAKRISESAILQTAAATKQELAPVAASQRSPQPEAPVPAKEQPPARPAAVLAVEPALAVAPRPIEPAPAPVGLPTAPAPAETAGRDAPASTPAKPLAPTASAALAGAVPAVAAPATERPQSPAAEVKVASASPPVTTPDARVASPDESAPREEVSDPTDRSGESAEAAPAADRDESPLSQDGQAPTEMTPPPPLQLGWVIGVLLGLTVLLIAWIVYRASVGH